MSEPRKTTSRIAVEYLDRRKYEQPLDASALMSMIRETQQLAAETVRRQAVSFLEYCLIVPPEVALQMISEVVAGKRKEF